MPMTALAEHQFGFPSTQAFADVAEVFRQHGALLVRGFAFGLDEFETLTRHICGAFHQVGTRQAMRQQVGDGYTTEVFPQNFILLGHSEGAYRPVPAPPEVCFFLCITPPAAAGGETTVIDGAAMLDEIPVALRQRLELVGVRYESLWEPARWKVEFSVDNEGELCTLLQGLPGVSFRLEAGMLSLLYSAQAVTFLCAGVPVFANGVLAHLSHIAHPRYAGLSVYSKASNKVWFGDGTRLDDDSVNQLIDAHDQVALYHRWQANDLLVLDNRRYMHGRNMTSEPCARRLISRFGRLA